ncbi:MAG: magnesium transporter [Gammaproteobacteria bacterium]|jgi:magnesium transporter|nr:magnesium transporter [Gammaproteobacteria bacterium]
MESAIESIGSDLIELVLLDLELGHLRELRMALDELHAADLAHILESLPPEKRKRVWELIDAEVHGEVLGFMREEARASIIGEMPEEQLVAAAGEMNVEDLAEVLETLPVDLGDAIVDKLEEEHRQRLEVVRSFPEGTAGRLMDSEVLGVHDDVTMAVVLRWIRRHEALPPHTDALMVVDEESHYLGKLDIATLLTAQPESLVRDLMRRDVDKVQADASTHDVVALFERRDLISVAVVDERDVLLGRISIEGVVELIREEAEHSMMKQAGLDEEEDLFAPVVPSARRRGVWLGINLITVFLAAWVIGQFEEVLEKFVALAVLMPVVASMGGIAGSQTLTLTIRGLALDQIAKSNVRWLTLKEIGVGGLNGIVWSIVVAFVAYLWFWDAGIAVVIAVATILNLFAAALSGIWIPLLLNRMGIDPALSGAVILTTVTDIIGFLSFLGLATVFLL